MNGCEISYMYGANSISFCVFDVNLASKVQKKNNLNENYSNKLSYSVVYIHGVGKFGWAKPELSFLHLFLANLHIRRNTTHSLRTYRKSLCARWFPIGWAPSREERKTVTHKHLKTNFDVCSIIQTHTHTYTNVQTNSQRCQPTDQHSLYHEFIHASS